MDIKKVDLLILHWYFIVVSQLIFFSPNFEFGCCKKMFFMYLIPVVCLSLHASYIIVKFQNGIMMLKVYHNTKLPTNHYIYETESVYVCPI